MGWFTYYDYSEMIEKYLEETEEKNVNARDHVNIVRGATEIVYDKFTNEPVIYRPIIKYYFYLDDIKPGEEYEQIKSSQFIDEMVDINSFK